ncbi:TrmH family RNA methyltransferase [Tenacibaculum maritimum]|uniref:Putative rRNA methylase n=2 Tax=Tenacibaculum maritimum TaxID=107401 RepID=A0A2H1EA82_9FLAO|nr:RNA methyltransferase [Tenacibaculum maritimum]MCD9562732.1 RNA methyltransferase [Tenacibaculum maritimum]MCD9564794.1 RNA methyltransferase [Tenacibaculum maritimum]MCD9577923.1 RNA methyltransferase [Tenacibaculum maritimum]MCD9596868.1 RNA methyltransferase [Tenacibaculum maritimum]MCD9614824.1 RNA methyltransferase [Tenacibaculum maritimum]
MKQITSVQNSYIKELLKLQDKSRERRKKKLFIIEGKREISLAIKGNYKIDTYLFVPDIFSKKDLELLNTQHATQIEISKDVYEKLAYRDSTEGIIAVVKAKDFSLKNIHFKNKKPLILVAESLEKPGNIGAILRTADAANIDAVFIADPKTDLYNPNSIRSSVGCLFTNQIAIGSAEEIIGFLKENNISIYSATLQNSNEYHQETYTNASAIVVGTEATGLTEIWRKNATQNINIPMRGEIDSMNVSVAAAIIIFEAKRQREFH